MSWAIVLLALSGAVHLIAWLIDQWAQFTPEFAAAEAGVPAAQIVDVARRIGAAGSRFACHTWRAAGSGNLGGWTVARALHLLSVLTGSVGTRGGTSPAAWNKFKPDLPLDARLERAGAPVAWTQIESKSINPGDPR